MVVRIDWYQNDHGQWVLAIEDDALPFVFDIVVPDARLAERTVQPLGRVRAAYETDGSTVMP